MIPPAYEACRALEHEPEGMTKDEWFQIAVMARPDLGVDEYEAMWDTFQKLKAERKHLRSVN